MSLAVMTRHMRIVILDSLVAADGLLEDCKCGLFQNDFTPHDEMVIGDLDFADFAGYALKTAVVFDQAYNDGNADDQRIAAASLQWNMTDDVAPQTIYGYYVTTTAGALVFAQRFDEPVEMVDADSSVIAQVVLPSGA